MKTLHRTLFALGLALPSLAAFSSPLTSIWDATADFTPTSLTNPNGVWSYGYDPASMPGYQMKVFDAYQLLSLTIWTDSSYNDLNTPVFGKNFGSTTINGIQPGQIGLHPGPVASGDAAILRFTAPTTDNYAISAQFFDGDSGETLAWVILNGNDASPLSSLGVTSKNPNFADPSYLLQAGDTLDFVVGNAGEFHFDSTPLSVVISSSRVPEPASLALVLAAMGALGLQVRLASASDHRPLRRVKLPKLG